MSGPVGQWGREARGLVCGHARFGVGAYGIRPSHAGAATNARGWARGGDARPAPQPPQTLADGRRAGVGHTPRRPTVGGPPDGAPRPTAAPAREITQGGARNAVVPVVGRADSVTRSRYQALSVGVADDPPSLISTPASSCPRSSSRVHRSSKKNRSIGWMCRRKSASVSIDGRRSQYPPRLSPASVRGGRWHPPRYRGAGEGGAGLSRQRGGRAGDVRRVTTSGCLGTSVPSRRGGLARCQRGGAGARPIPRWRSG